MAADQSSNGDGLALASWWVVRDYPVDGREPADTTGSNTAKTVFETLKRGLATVATVERSDTQCSLHHSRISEVEKPELKSFPVYPEDRSCGRPTARRAIDLFDNTHRHTLSDGFQVPTVFITELPNLQQCMLKLPEVAAKEYRK